MGEQTNVGRSDRPRPGELWIHKGTGTKVRILYCVGAGPFGSPRQVQWASERGQGKDSVASFLDRFERTAIHA